MNLPYFEDDVFKNNYESDYLSFSNPIKNFDEEKTMTRGINEYHQRFSARMTNPWEQNKMMYTENPLKSTREKSPSYGATYQYSPLRMKMEIDGRFHEEYRDKMAELETNKYNYEKLKEAHEMTLTRMENIEKENRNLTTKYQKVKDHYAILKEHYNANKSLIESFQDELSKKKRQAEELEKQLKDTQYEKKSFLQENTQLRKILDEEKRTSQQENHFHADFEIKLKLQLEQYKKETQEQVHQIQNLQEALKFKEEALKSKEEEYSRKTEHMVVEKNKGFEHFTKVQDQLAESLEVNAKLREEIIQQQIIGKNSQSENEILKERIRSLESLLGENMAKERLNEVHEKEYRIAREIVESQENEISILKNQKEYFAKAIDSIQEELLDSKTLLQEERKKHEKEIERLNSVMLENKQVYQKEVESLVSKVMELNKEKSQLLNDSNINSNKAKYDFNYLEKEVPKFEKKIYHLESSNEKLRKELDQTKSIAVKSLSTNSKTETEPAQERLSWKRDEKLFQESSRAHESEAENNDRNPLSYSHSSADLSDMLESRYEKTEGSRNYSNRKETDKENENIELIKTSVKAHQESGEKSLPQREAVLTLKPSFENKLESQEHKKTQAEAEQKPPRNFNHDLQRLENRYNEIKLKYKR